MEGRLQSQHPGAQAIFIQIHSETKDTRYWLPCKTFSGRATLWTPTLWTPLVGESGRDEATAVFPYLSPYSNDPKDCLSPPGGGMLGWGKGRGCVPQPHSAEKAPVCLHWQEMRACSPTCPRYTFRETALVATNYGVLLTFKLKQKCAENGGRVKTKQTKKLTGSSP